MSKIVLLLKGTRCMVCNEPKDDLNVYESASGPTVKVCPECEGLLIEAVETNNLSLLPEDSVIRKYGSVQEPTDESARGEDA